MTPRSIPYTSLSLIAAFVSTVLTALPLAGQSGAFVSLFDGTLDGWTIQNTEADNFSIRDGAIRVEGPGGWLRSEQRYSDFILRTEFRFVTDDADSGIYVRALGETEFMRGWPNESYQIQVRNPATPSRLPPVGGLFRHGMPAGELDFDTDAVENAVAPTGDWQTLQIQVAGNALTVWLNEVEVMSASNIRNSPGYIGLQGEVGIVEYRSVEIREELERAQQPPIGEAPQDREDEPQEPYSIIPGTPAVRFPVVVHHVNPQYTEEAREARFEGTVLLEAIVRSDGSVEVVRVIRGLGFGMDQSAIEALSQWRFTPATRNGEPVDVSLNIEVNFNLRDEIDEVEDPDPQD